MSVNSSGGDNDRAFCWEQVNKTNRTFRISHVFAPKSCADRLLPLYALFSVCEQMGSSFSDEDVAASKLHWWRMECLQKGGGESRHPVMKELGRTGAHALLPRDRLAQLLDGAGNRLNGNAPAELDALQHICIELQQPQFELELAVTGLPDGLLPGDQGHMARAGLLQLIRESVDGKAPGAYWWIPMNLLARHGLRRDDISGNPESRDVARLFAEVLKAGEQWGRDGAREPADAAEDYSPARHLFAINDL